MAFGFIGKSFSVQSKFIYFLPLSLIWCRESKDSFSIWFFGFEYELSWEYRSYFVWVFYQGWFTEVGPRATVLSYFPKLYRAFSVKKLRKVGQNFDNFQIFDLNLGIVHIIRNAIFWDFKLPLLPLRNAKPYKSLYLWKASYQNSDPSSPLECYVLYGRPLIGPRWTPCALS